MAYSNYRAEFFTLAPFETFFCHWEEPITNQSYIRHVGFKQLQNSYVIHFMNIARPEMTEDSRCTQVQLDPSEANTNAGTKTLEKEAKNLSR